MWFNKYSRVGLIFTQWSLEFRSSERKFTWSRGWDVSGRKFSRVWLIIQLMFDWSKMQSLVQSIFVWCSIKRTWNKGSLYFFLELQPYFNLSSIRTVYSTISCIFQFSQWETPKEWFFNFSSNAVSAYMYNCLLLITNRKWDYKSYRGTACLAVRATTFFMSSLNWFSNSLL